MPKSCLTFQRCNEGITDCLLDYQSRLLKGGFSALFGPALQELVLKLSFSLADVAVSGTDTRLPDVLGIIARAKTSQDAIAISQEVALIGQFVCESSSNIRFAERGVFNYATKSVELDIELLEDIREEACHGMDAFDSIAAMSGNSGTQDLAVLSTFLLQTLERMAKRLEVFYSKLARLKACQPELERSPARARWNLLRTRIRDGSFFILTQERTLGAAPSFVPSQNRNGDVDFDNVMNRIQASIRSAPKMGPPPQTLNAMHLARATTPPVETNAMAAHGNNTAMRAMSSFIDANMRSIRRLSKIPPMTLSFEQLQKQFEGDRVGRLPTPPSSSNFTKSPRPNTPSHATSLERMMVAPNGRLLNSRTTITTPTYSNSFPSQGMDMGSSMVMSSRSPPTPPLEPMAAMVAMMSKLNVPSRGRSVPPSPARSRSGSVMTVPTRNGSVDRHMSKLSTNSLRSFRLGSGEGRTVRIAPTF